MSRNKKRVKHSSNCFCTHFFVPFFFFNFNIYVEFELNTVIIIYEYMCKLTTIRSILCVDLKFTKMKKQVQFNIFYITASYML